MSQIVTLTDLLKRSFREMMKDVGTSIPGAILSFDNETQLAQLQIAVRGIDKTGESFTPPELVECPVYFSGGGQYFIEHEIAAGDEGIILFSQRCIDAWNNQGGITENPILRFHDFSDAYFLPGLRSQPNKINLFQNNGVRLRNKVGDQYIWLKNDGTAAIKVSSLDVDGTITATNDVVVAGKSFNGHTHVGSPTAPNGAQSNTGTLI